MDRLNSIEIACRDVLLEIRDLMAPGHPTMNTRGHMELSGRVRDCLVLLMNKEGGCVHGLHAGYCDCTPETPGRYIR